MATVRFQLNSAGMAELLNSAGVRAAVAGPADRAASAARSGAPVDSGEYRAGIERRSVTTDRAVERVYATAPHSGVVEARTGNLARSLGAA